MSAQMYKLNDKYTNFDDDDYIVVEKLENVVCLMNARTNDLVWATNHTLNIKYVEKEKHGD